MKLKKLIKKLQAAKCLHDRCSYDCNSFGVNDIARAKYDAAHKDLISLLDKYEKKTGSKYVFDKDTVGW